MSIQVKISAVFHPYTNNKQTAVVTGKTVGECLDKLVIEFPKLKRVLFDRHGKLHRHIDIYVNQESSYPEELAKPVKDGDELHLVMAIAGG